MINAEAFVQAVRAQGFALWSGVPCSYLKPFINFVIDDTASRYVAAANEGDAIAIAAGASLAGSPAIAMFQNSGLGNAVNPLTSLTHTFNIPILVITTLRGEPGGAPDEPQHELMGAITGDMLALMQIPWEFFPTAESDIAPALDRAMKHMREARRPYAFVMKKDSVADHAIRSKPEPRPVSMCLSTSAPRPVGSRADVLRKIQSVVRADDAIVATTGFTGRELFGCEDRENQLYVVGSMGCTSSLGLGLALAQPARRVIVLDGDGALLMRMGALATIGYERPPNLLHVLLDNELHESTGGQSTVSHSIDLCAIAAASGYPRSVRAASLDEIGAEIARAGKELSFVHVKMLPGVAKGLPRPTVKPPAVAERMRQFLAREPKP